MSQEDSKRSTWMALGVLCTLAVISDLSYAGLTPLLVAYGDTLHFDLSTSGWLATAEGIGFTAGALLGALFGKALLPTRPRPRTMLFALLGTALSTIFAYRWSKLTTIVVGNVGLIAAVVLMSEWHTIAGLLVAMAFLNMSVTFLTPAMLAALAHQNVQGSQWGNLASQAGYSVGPAAAATIAEQGAMTVLVVVSVAGFAASIIFAWLGLASVPVRRRPVPL